MLQEKLSKNDNTRTAEYVSENVGFCIQQIEGGYIFLNREKDRVTTITITDDLDVCYSMAYNNEPNVIYELNFISDLLEGMDIVLMPGSDAHQ